MQNCMKCHTHSQYFTFHDHSQYIHVFYLKSNLSTDHWILNVCINAMEVLEISLDVNRGFR